jgi:3D (Asp-Asp-Asp) domain-containing protein
VLGRTRSRTARLVAFAAVLTFTAASAALAASGTADQASTPSLDARTQRAVLGLYALDSQLHAWHARIASLDARAAGLRHQRAALRQELVATRASLRTGQKQLALDLRALYQQNNVDAVAVVLGADSLAKGLGQLDDLSRVADQSRQIVAQTAASRSRLLRSQLRLAAEGRRLERSLVAARRAEQRLASATAARLAYVTALRGRERMRAAQVRSVEAAAQTAQQRSQQLQRANSTPVSGKRQLVVSATCYDLPGRTATGVPVGHGVVAVDPSVIPLGTRMHVPGYGNGVAADVGGGIRGRIIDLWMTSTQCGAWGRRTVTITLY